MPQAYAARRAADDVDLPPRIRALAETGNITLFMHKSFVRRQHHHNAGGA